MFMKKIIAVAALVLCSSFVGSSAVGATGTAKDIRFAVLAPEGSTWVNLMKIFSDELKQKSKGSVNFKIFPGGISGDEFDVIRKMRMGKIDSAGFTGVGLGQILPAIRVLEIPRLFDNYQEVDYVSNKLRPFFEQELDKKGYVLLGWAEVGFVNMFSNKKLDSLSSLNGVKMWAWEGDPLAKELFTQLKLVPNPMPVTDVFTSLQTGLINAVYVSPLAAIAMQWFTKTKYMTTLKITDAAGAILMTKSSFNKLSPADQKLLRAETDTFCKKLITESRKDNDKAYNTLKKNGVQFVDMNKADTIKFDKISKSVWKSLVGKLYDQKTLDLALKYRDEYRKNKK